MQIPEYIEVRSPTGSPVAYISPESDGLKECWPDINLNGATTLLLSLPIGSDKWAYLTDENCIIAGGKEYVLLKPDAIELVRDGKKIWGKVVAQESWTLMGKQYATVSNDPTNPTPSWSQVSILSGGASAGGYSAGSAGSALTYLLNGSGWTIETCDVTGTHDLEMEKESLLACINKVQELWGGFLVWNSINHTISLRDETLWQNYTGFQIRYRKNEKTITKTVDNDITTRLYPFGADDLNIASVNSDALYLDNNTHTSRVLEGIYINQEITDPQELKDRAIKELAILCKPRINYKTSIIDLRTLPEWKHETFDCGDMADVIDEDIGADERVRIIRYKYNLFQPWNCEIELGDPIKKIASTIADSTAVTNFFNSNVKPNISFQNILKAKIDSAATTINGANGDYTLADGISTWWGELSDVTGQRKVTRVSPGGIIISNTGGVSWGTAIDGDGIYGNKVIVSDIYALSSGDSYTKMGGSGVVVTDINDIVRAHLGQYAEGKFGLKLTNGDIIIDGSSGKSRIIINPDDAFKIQKLVGSTWTDVLSEDADGNLIATNADIDGTVRARALYLGATNVLTELNKIDDSAVDIKASTIEALSIQARSVSSDWVYAGDIVASQITTTGLSAERIYDPDLSGNYMEIGGGGNYLDLKLIKTNATTIFEIYDAGTSIDLKSRGYTFLDIASASIKPQNNWDFSNAIVTGITATAVFG